MGEKPLPNILVIVKNTKWFRVLFSVDNTNPIDPTENENDNRIIIFFILATFDD